MGTPSNTNFRPFLRSQAGKAPANLPGFFKATLTTDKRNHNSKATSTKHGTVVAPLAVPTVQTPAPTSEAPAPTIEVPAPTSEAPAPTIEVPAPTSEAPAPTIEVPAPTSEAPAHSLVTMASGLAIKPSQFHGKPGDKAETWLAEFKNLCISMYRLTEDQAQPLIKFYLAGQAKAWYDSLPSDMRENSATLEAEMRKRFDGSDGSFSIHSIRQLVTETVSDYTTRFMTATNDRHMPVVWLVANYIDGLRSTIRKVVKSQDLCSIDSARRAAIRAELAEEDSRTTEVSAISPAMEAMMTQLASRLDDLSSQVSQMPGAHKQDQARASTPRQGRNDLIDSRRSYICAICDKRGHYERECYRLPDMKKKFYPNARNQTQ